MNVPTMLRKPLVGGVFGHQGRFELASQATIAAGLHACRYFVIEARAGRVLAIASSKAEVLAAARRALQAALEQSEPAWRQASLWSAADLHAVPDWQPPPPRPVSRRRRDVFERSGGRCHYCGTALELAGSWHVEHQLPQALGGGDAPGNLVAACVSCNLAKADRTALEFVSGRGYR